MRPRRSNLVSLGVALLIATSPMVAVSTAHAAEVAACDSFDQPLRQLVRPSTGANLLTRWDSEAVLARERYGFTTDLGTLAEVAASGGTGLSPVWRLHRSGDFVWADDDDAEALVQEGYRKQFVNFYAAQEDVPCLSAVYRFERGRVHRMATADQTDALTRDGWTREGIAFYARTNEGAGPRPDPDPTDPTDRKFSIAVVPDTQNESNSAADPRFSNRASWLVQNKAALDLRYALQVGDLTNWGAAAPVQFTNVSNSLRPLEAALPWAATIGNHDTAAVCVGGSACPGASARETVRDTRAYNAAFPLSRFPNVRGAFEAGKIDNSYQTFAAGGVDWMVLSLELWPRTAAVAWARSVVAAHPGHNVIILTHAYLDADGSIGDSNGGYGANSPQYLYDNLVKVYPNVKMVLSGHVGDAASRTDTGANGNKILSLLQTYHSATNPVRLVEIDTAAGSVSSRVYAPLTRTDFSSDTTSTAGMSFVS